MPYAMMGSILGGSAISAVGGIAGDALGMMENQQNMQFQQQMNLIGPSEKVQGLRAAGLNPMLAVGGGLQGAYPNPATAAMQNPTAGAGQIVSQLANTQAQTRLTNAQAALTEQQTPNGSMIFPLGPDGKPDWDQVAMMGQKGTLGTLTAMGMGMQIRQASATVDNLEQLARTGASQQGLNDAMTQIQRLDGKFREGVMQWAITQAENEANLTHAEATTAEAQAKIMGTRYGPIISLFKNLAGPAASLSSIFK